MALTTMITLKPEVIQLIRGNQTLKNKLQLNLNISHTTLYRYLENNDEKLTTATALKIIGSELGLCNDSLLIEC